MAGLFSRIKTWVKTDNLKAADINGEFNNIITNLNAPQLAGDSPTVARFQAEEDPGSQGSESLPTSVAGELRRLRFALRRALGTTFWYDTPSSDINSLAALFAAGATVSQNRIDSARADLNGQPSFLIPNGSTGLRLKASVTPFKAYIKGSLITVNADVDFSGLTAATSFTCLVNDAAQTGNQSSKLTGESGSVITIDTNVGSAPVAGSFNAWKIVHSAATEYFFGRFDSATQISACYRGFFFDSSSVTIPRLPTSDNDAITMCKAVYVFFTNVASTPALEITYNLPTISGTQPLSGSSGDWWLDLNVNIWKKFNGTSWADGNGLWIGMGVMDGASIAGTRPFDFGKAFSATNTVIPTTADVATVKSKYLSSTISVYGSLMKFDKNILSWSMATNLDSGITEAANTTYYFYITQFGVVVISDVAPHRRREDLLGDYHPSKPWRCVAVALNDGSLNLGTSTQQDTITLGKVIAESLQINSVVTSSLVDQSVTTAKIADANVTTAKILDANITTSKLATNLNMPGKAVQENGNNLVVANSNDTNSLAVLRGTINGNGTIATGSGFSVSSHASVGIYAIAFSTAFADVPTIVVTPSTPGATYAASVESSSTSGFVVHTYNTTPTLVDSNFQFVAIGQRA